MHDHQPRPQVRRSLEQAGVYIQPVPIPPFVGGIEDVGLAARNIGVQGDDAGPRGLDALLQLPEEGRGDFRFGIDEHLQLPEAETQQGVQRVLGVHRIQIGGGGSDMHFPIPPKNGKILALRRRRSA